MDEMGLVTWKLVQIVLWAGPLGIAAFLAVLSTGSAYVGYLTGERGK